MARFRWELQQDIALASEVATSCPRKLQDWDEIAVTLSAAFSSDEKPVQFKARGSSNKRKSMSPSSLLEKSELLLSCKAINSTSHLWSEYKCKDAPIVILDRNKPSFQLHFFAKNPTATNADLNFFRDSRERCDVTITSLIYSTFTVTADLNLSIIKISK